MKTRRREIVVAGLMLMGLLLAVGCNPPEVTKPCVVMLGDSIFHLSSEGPDLFELAGDTYRTYYIGGAQLVGGPIKTIEQQYYDARDDDPNIRTIIMDGGGNDILIGANAICSAGYGTALSAECHAEMDTVLAAAERMFEIAVADGVENVIFQGYYYVRPERLWQVTDEFQEKGIALVNELNARYPDVNIVYVDPRPHFERGGTDHLRIDGIHPSPEAAGKLAQLVWDAMKTNDIEQNIPCEPTGNNGNGCN